MMRCSILWTLIALAALAVAPACEDSPPPEGESDAASAGDPVIPSGTNRHCESDGDCPKGEGCLLPLGNCKLRCDVDTDCPNNAQCGSDGLCVQCSADQDCGEQSHCHPVAYTCVQCTEDAHCPGGVCQSEIAACVQCTEDAHCPGGRCHPELRRCAECIEPSDCGDGEPCTVDACTAGRCAYAPVDTPECESVVQVCSVSSECTAGAAACATCSGGVCRYELPRTCELDADCPPAADPCRVAQCQQTECGGALCGERLIAGCGPQCETAADCPPPLPGECAALCLNGACTAPGVGAPSCECVNDAQCASSEAPCVTSRCEANHCVEEVAANGTECSDGNACTLGDACSQGECAAGPFAVCSDGNPCTDDGCQPASGCTAVAVLDGAPCDDGDACTEATACLSGACAGGSPVTCDDGNPCTTDVCSASQDGCTATPLIDDFPCDDGDACTASSVCLGGFCTVLGHVNCNDGNACTLDTCDGGECVHAPTTDAAPCDDGDPCTSGTTCGAGACGGGAAVTCDDGEFCTSDTCASDLGGCTFVPVIDDLPCDDGDLCTPNSVCFEGACFSLGVVDCSDENPCTDDLCLPESGCLSAAVGAAVICDDGDPCTATSFCAGATCVAGDAVACVDGDPCTSDSCHAASGGCVFAPIADLESCDDGDPCSTASVCDSGMCVGVKFVDCTDSEPCTKDFCTAGACAHVPMPDQEACDDGDFCTEGDSCVSGQCTPGALLAGCGTACAPLGAPCKLGTKSCPQGTTCTCIDSCPGCADCVSQACAPLDALPYLCDADSPCMVEGEACQCAGEPSEGGDCSVRACAPTAGCTCGSDTDCYVPDGYCMAVCKFGLCVPVPFTGACTLGAEPEECSPGQQCTADGCGTFCGPIAAACKSTAPDACSDGNPCTADGCDAAGACQNVPVSDGAACAIASPCALKAACLAGTCTPISFDPGCCTPTKCGDATCDAQCESALTCPEDCAVSCDEALPPCPAASGGAPVVSSEPSPFGDCLKFDNETDLSLGLGDDHVIGSPGDDVFTGGAGNDFLAGMAGADVLDGESGADILWGGDGADIITCGFGHDTVRGGAGADTIEVSRAPWPIHVDGGCDDDHMIFRCRTPNDLDIGASTFPASASAKGDFVFLDGQRVTFVNVESFEFLPDCPLQSCSSFTPIEPGCATPTSVGSPDVDTFKLGDEADCATGVGGNDVIDGGGGNDLIDGGTGGDILLGGTGDDVLVGGAGKDDLRGGPGRDTLLGGESGDLLDGGPGADSLFGGDGDDDAHYHASEGGDWIDGGCGQDTLTIHCAGPSVGGEHPSTWAPGAVMGTLLLTSGDVISLYSIETVNFLPDDCP